MLLDNMHVMGQPMRHFWKGSFMVRVTCVERGRASSSSLLPSEIGYRPFLQPCKLVMQINNPSSPPR